MTKEIFDIIKNLNDLGTTVLMITHRVDYAAAYAHRAVVMNRGEVAFDGPVWELISNPEIMRANALELPDITKLALQLNEHGVPPWTIKYEQLEYYLQQLMGGSDGN
jgi:ABC-type methionine transport system ATPase subunit